jgi:hypothetical protein
MCIEQLHNDTHAKQLLVRPGPVRSTHTVIGTSSLPAEKSTSRQHAARQMWYDATSPRRQRLREGIINTLDMKLACYRYSLLYDRPRSCMPLLLEECRWPRHLSLARTALRQYTGGQEMRRYMSECSLCECMCTRYASRQQPACTVPSHSFVLLRCGHHHLLVGGREYTPCKHAPKLRMSPPTYVL